MFKPGMSNYAYGWVVRKAPLGAQGEPIAIIEHGGGINGFNTLISRMPESKNLIALFNTTGGTKLGEMFQKIAGILFGKPYCGAASMRQPSRGPARSFHYLRSSPGDPRALRPLRPRGWGASTS